MATYEQSPPNLVTVILEAHGFTQLLERVNFMHRIAEQNAHVVGWTRATRAAVARQARLLATLEQRDQTLTAQVLAQRNSVAALQAALLRQQISELAARGQAGAKLHALNARLSSLEAKARQRRPRGPPPPATRASAGSPSTPAGWCRRLRARRPRWRR